MSAQILELYPHTGTMRALDGTYLARDLRVLGTPEQPFVYANFVSSLDGRIAIVEARSASTDCGSQGERRRRMRLAAPSFALQFPQHRSAFGQLAVEELARQAEHVRHEWTRQRVVRLGTLAPDRDDAAPAQYGEVLRHDRLVKRERGLEIVDGAFALDELFEDADARRVGEDAAASTPPR